MGEVVSARTSATLHPPSPPTVHQLSGLVNSASFMSVTVIYVKKTLCVVLMSLWEQMVEMISLQRKKPSAKEETRKTTKQPALESCVLSWRGRVGGGGGE